MSKEESKSGGLLSKVARFVRHPTVNWSELDTFDQGDEESQYSKQALKDMLERKRQNDFVRKREFDNLRKLRQTRLSRSSSQSANAAPETPVMPSSFLQTSQSTNLGERAETIKKIDEIEAQMAQQWWRGKLSGDDSTMPQPLPEGGNTMPESFKNPPPAGVTLPLLSDALPSELSLPPTAVTGIPGKPSMRGDTDFSPAFASTEVSPPATDGLLPPSFVSFEHDVSLEEAAIVFANGDYEGAEVSLKALIDQRSQDSASQLPVWLALLDMYRAAGWQIQFEDAAMDFASRFGRSAPQWFGMPQEAGKLSDASQEAAATAGFRWQAPVVLSESSLKALLTGKERSPGPWTLDWSALEQMDPAVMVSLLAVVEQWAGEKGDLIFAGQDRLLAVLSKLSPSGDRNIDQDWWHLRLAMQRLMHLQDDFELTALDYCVTYELSPPSWKDPVCAYATEGQEQGVQAFSAKLKGPESVLPDALWRERAPKYALQGVIDGDALPWLTEVQNKAKLGEVISIDCTKLVRMDFAAAGSVLNWAADMQSLGHVLQFREMHQLLAVFFNVVGIQEHAQVRPRKD